MLNSDKLLVNTYATFLVDTATLAIMEYNDFASPYLSGNKQKISDVITWKDSISKKIEFEKDKKLIVSTATIEDQIDLVAIVQVMVYQNNSYYNVILIDNLEDIRTLESRSLDNEIAGNGLFSNIFQYSPIGLVLVDSETKLFKANKYMFDCFDLKYHEVIGKRFGNIFGCSSVAESRFLCGEADACKECKLRDSITNVLKNKITLESLDLGHDFEINGRTVTKWFTVSASPVHYGNDVYALVSFVDITQRVRMEDRLRELGITDPLTRLYNRSHIMKLFTDGLSSMDFDYLSLALIDIDNFKIVNDTYGHLKGDEILMLLADILKDQLRFSDYVGRYGGEEFLIVFTDTQLNTAESVLSRIAGVFREKSKDILDKPVTFSTGLTEVILKTIDVNEDSNSILSLTDKLMYEAKAKGKDRIQALRYSKG